MPTKLKFFNQLPIDNPFTTPPPPTPPSITTQPSATSVAEGATASFSVVATGTGTLSYQWQVNTGTSFVNVSNGTGGTTASYTTVTTTAGMNGYSYRVIVTNAGGSTTSSAGGLTVTTSGGGTGAPTALDFTIKFTGTFPARVDDIYRPTTFSADHGTAGDFPIAPLQTALVPGGATHSVSGEGTWAIDGPGNISFFPEEGFSGTATHGYTLTDTNGGVSNTANATFEFDPFYWDGVDIIRTAPTADATVAPAGLQAAITAASSGDVIHVTDGTYSGARITVDKPLTIWSVNKYGAKFGLGITISANNVTLDGIEITDCASGQDALSSTGDNIIIQSCRVQSPTGRQNLLIGSGSSTVAISYCEFIKEDGSNLPHDPSPAGDALYGGPTTINVLLNGATDITVYRCLLSGGYRRLMEIQNCTNVLIDHNWIENSRRQGAYAISCFNVRYINNRVVNVGEAGMQWNNCFAAPGGEHGVEFNTVWTTYNPLRGDRTTDAINLYQSGGNPSNIASYYKNRTWNSGVNSAGSGGMMCDTGGGYIHRVENVVVNTGNVGLGLAGGGHCLEARNKIWGRNSVLGHAVGMFIWRQTSVPHNDVLNGFTYGWGNHVLDSNRIDFIRNTTGANVDFWGGEDPNAFTGENTNLYGAAVNY